MNTPKYLPDTSNNRFSIPMPIGTDKINEIINEHAALCALAARLVGTPPHALTMRDLSNSQAIIGKVGAEPFDIAETMLRSAVDDLVVAMRDGTPDKPTLGIRLALIALGVGGSVS